MQTIVYLDISNSYEKSLSAIIDDSSFDEIVVTKFYSLGMTDLFFHQ